MTWSTAVQDIRALLSDRSVDKFAWKKRVVGITDGVNTRFKTFEFRRVSAFVGATLPIGIFVNDVAVTVASESLVTGEFVLSVAPTEGSRIEATYYHQWFEDDQLQIFLTRGAEFLGYTDYTTIEQGLRPACSEFAKAEAYIELSVRFARMLSESFMMEDLPKESTKAAMESYQKLADMCRKNAELLMKNFYTRQGRSLAPNFGSIAGNVRPVNPAK